MENFAEIRDVLNETLGNLNNVEFNRDFVNKCQDMSGKEIDNVIRLFNIQGEVDQIKNILHAYQPGKKSWGENYKDHAVKKLKYVEDNLDDFEDIANDITRDQFKYLIYIAENILSENWYYSKRRWIIPQILEMLYIKDPPPKTLYGTHAENMLLKHFNLRTS